jgi:hypothetical protein
MAILEEERAAVLRTQLSKLFEIGLTKAHSPAVLSLILSAASRPEDVLDLAIQIRNSPEAVEYRRWSNDLSLAIQDGSITEVVGYLRELERITGKLNKRYGVSATEKSAELVLGWGPLEIKKPVSRPAIFNTPLRVKRHLWILYNLHKFTLTARSWAPAVDRVLTSHFPGPLQNAVRNLDLSEFREVPRIFS